MRSERFSNVVTPSTSLYGPVPHGPALSRIHQLFSPQPCSAQNWRLPMCLLLSLINAVLSGVGKWNRIVYGSRISSHDPGLKFKNCPALNGCCAWVFSSQLSLTTAASKGSPL